VDIRERQLWSPEQAAVLESLARSVARPGARFLEVGSWCGDSSVVLARVARTVGGCLVCVDWWRGSPGTTLTDIARSVDIYQLFWQRIQRAGLEDTVIPVRGRSQQIVQTLGSASFDFVFLDGDHRYSAASADVREYARLIRGGGILCGHDCEGRIEDYDRVFLESGKESDCYESVHCGVVLAVGEAFPQFALHHGVWSVARAEDGAWRPPDLPFIGLAAHAQGPVPPIAGNRDWQLFRYGRKVYAVPRSMREADVRSEETRNDSRIRQDASISDLQRELVDLVLASDGEPGTPEATTNVVSPEQMSAALALARAREEDLTRKVAAQESQLEELAKTLNDTGQQLAALHDALRDETRRRSEADVALARAEARLAAVTEQFREAQITLELRRLGVADADGTSATGSLPPLRD
jgi:predicted O-methyltransferase YrrM